jgi:hypothetical protein
MPAQDAVAKAADALQSTLGPAGHARAAAHRAVDSAATVRDQAGRAGGPAVWQRLNVVHSELQQAYQQLQAVTSMLQATTKDTQTARAGQDTEEMANALTAATIKTSAAAGRLAAVGEKLKPLPAQIAAALKGSKPEPLINAVNAVIHQLPTAVATITSAEGTTRESIAEIRETGNF